MYELKIFLLKLLGVVISAPLFAYGSLFVIDMVQKAWKTNSKRKKWIALSFAFFGLEIFLGLLR